MSILKTTNSGMNAPFTEALALKLGYTIKGYDLESGPPKKIWNIPDRILEKIPSESMKWNLRGNRLWSNQNGVFFFCVWYGKQSVIDKLYNLSMLEKYWLTNDKDEEDLYAILATNCNPNHRDIEALKKKVLCRS